MVRADYLAMALTGWLMIVPSNNAPLLGGLVQARGTPPPMQPSSRAHNRSEIDPRRVTRRPCHSSREAEVARMVTLSTRTLFGATSVMLPLRVGGAG